MSFDWKNYGKSVRHIREYRARCSRSSLVRQIEEATGVRMTTGTIERIESGRNVPKAEDFFALNTTLFGDPMPQCLKERWFRCR